MKIKHFSFNKLLYNNRFVMFFSLLLAVVIWFIIAMQFSPQDERIVTNVPVKIEMSNNLDAFDLQIFGKSDFTVDVTVIGKRYVISPNALSADDLIVTANTNYVDSSGKYSLKIEVTKKNPGLEFLVSKISDEYIDVYFDTYKEGEYPLIPEIISSEPIIPEGYYKDAEVLSAKTVTVSGPAAEVNKISRVFARITVDKTITATKTFKAEIVPVGEYGSVLKSLLINNGNADISVTLPVYKIVQLPVAITYKNSPAFFISNPLQYSSRPIKATFGVDEASLEGLDAISIGTIDFSSIKSGINKISIGSSDIKLIRVLDDTSEFIINIDASEFTEKRFSIPPSNIKLINVNQGISETSIVKGITGVTVVGTNNTLELLTPDNIFAEIDMENTLFEGGTITVPARLYIQGYDNCWVYGQYSVNIGVKVS
jgi:YbbR domain-containing protein